MSDATLPRERIGPLPVGPMGTHSLGWWGMWMIVLTEAALFAYLFFSYFYTAVQFDKSWLPQDQPPSMRYTLPATIVIVLSSVSMWYANRSLRRGARGGNALGLAVTLVLGIVFVVLQCLDWSAKSVTPRSYSYGSLYFTITGFHVAHVAAGVLMLLAILAWSLLGYFGPRRNTPVVVTALYWHFVVVTGVVSFITFDLTPYAMW
jgi:heme/copper-type cytochrome/quinol oxidase subunit 3